MRPFGAFFMNEIGAASVGYLLGAIPFAYLITRARLGIDIRTVDIGNAGAGSVIRTVGLGAGVLTLVGDVGKGVAAVLVAQLLGVGFYWVLASGMLAVLGHVFPVFIGFRGGQGVATAMGVFFALAPIAMGLTLAAMGLVLLVNLRKGASRRLFFIVACCAPLLPAFVYVIDRSLPLVIYTLVVVGFIAVRNWRRLRYPRTITHRLLGEMDDSA